MNPTEVPESPAPAIFDCNIHVYPSKDCPFESLLPDHLRLAVELGMDTQPWNGYRDPHGVDRRDVQCANANELADQHHDRLGTVRGVLQPQPGLYVSLIQNVDIADAMALVWNDWQAEYYLDRDPRLLGSACVNPADPLAWESWKRSHQGVGEVEAFQPGEEGK